MSNLIGQSLGRYHILEQLGEGGMATVYKAFDTRLERDVAVKIIRRNAFPPDQLDRILKRFEREAKSLARLSHPNIIKVIDYGEYNGAPYLVMEYMPGGTLKEKLKGRAMEWQEAVRLLIPIAEALEYAHEQKIIHRDIKPSNILLMQKGQPMLTDFGIAKILEVEETATLTGTGVGVGTPEYMAPEQWTGSATAQTDIYSLGVVLYEMVTGRKPYTADTPAAILLKQATEPLPRPGTIVSDLPDAVEKILLKALARKPQDRYQDAGTFVTAMENLLMGTGQKPVSTPSVRKPIEPDLETQDTYIQEETTSTKSQIRTYTEPPRKTRTTQTVNSVVSLQPKRTVLLLWVIGLGIFGLLLYMAFRNNGGYPAAVTQAPAIVGVPAATGAPTTKEASAATEAPVTTEALVVDHTSMGDSPNILWMSDCDPRINTDFCAYSSSFDFFEPFFSSIKEMNGTIDYHIPTSMEELSPYDVVIVNFCDDGGESWESWIDILREYVLLGGSEVVIGDNFCYFGKFSTAKIASMLTNEFGVMFTEEDDTTFVRSDFISKHPITTDIDMVYMNRHATLIISSPSISLVKMGDNDVIGVYDGAGTLVAIPDTAFIWGDRAGQASLISSSDNFKFWRNMLLWLTAQSRQKR